MKEQPVCPHCGQKMERLRTPYESTWGGEIHNVCFNNECGYYVESWSRLEEQGIEDTGYRCRLDPRGQCGPLAVWSSEALRDLIIRDEDEPKRLRTLDLFDEKYFVRDDETPDTQYYQNPEPIETLDSLALSAIEDFLAGLIRPGAAILDLMAGSDSHIKPDLQPSRIVGIGLDAKELDANTALTERIVQDLNGEDPLPFEEDAFDAALITLAIEYMTKPVEIFQEIARVLKSGGPLIVTYSNRTFPPKAVSVWKTSSDEERMIYVKKLMEVSQKLSVMGDYESVGKPRPKDDKYYMLGIPSDPVYAVWARPND